MRIPCLLVSDCAGDIFEIPELSMAGSSLDAPVLPGLDSLIPMPRSSLLFTLPGRAAMGYDFSGRLVTITEYGGRRVFPVAAFMPPGYLRTLHCAYTELLGAQRLPLYCYAAVGWKNGRFYVAGTRIDRRLCHEIADSALPEVDRKAAALLTRHPRNRLIAHLVHNCVFKYRCPNACNLALNKGECPIPISRACNASCIGCISLQPKNAGFPSSQHRIDFVPTVKEILDYVVPHCASARRPVISFGQGCEGEPLLQEGLIEEAIRGIRLRTKRGAININTNASIPGAVERLCRAGLNSMRVSLNSAQEEFYKAYYRPRGYSFEDVKESIRIAKRQDVWVSLNYLVFPGFTDHHSEINALKELLRGGRIDMLQTRNLNIDPQWFCREMNFKGLTGNALGMVQWVNCIRKAFPKVRLGYFNPASV